MYIVSVPNRGSPPAILLRESYREEGKVKNRTLANLSHWPPAKIAALQAVLRGESVAPSFAIVRSHHHGHVQAVLAAMKRLDFAHLVASRPSRQRDLVVAMVAARLLEPHSKLATTRWWHTTTLPQELAVADATEDELYAALDWLAEHQEHIEKKLASRHLEPHSLVLYDLSSSYVEGSHCPLAKRGYSRDGKRGYLQVNYGLLTNRDGCPVSIAVYAGNTTDCTTVLEQIDKVRQTFGVEHFAIVGDRGMIAAKQIAELKQIPGVEWITALKSSQIRPLVEQQVIQLGLFDQRNLFAFVHADFPGERLVACRNPLLAQRRADKRQALLDATQQDLLKVQKMVASGKLRSTDEIGVRVGRVINRFKMAKHFALDIGDQHFSFHLREAEIQAEAQLDGIYVLRTSLPETIMDDAETVRSYKLLTQVERAFRSLKTMDLQIRPIYHYLEQRVRAHIFLCMLAYYVEWHLRQAWQELLFDDEDASLKWNRDPVAPAQRSPQAQLKAQQRILADGSPVHSFQTLLSDLATIVRNVCQPSLAPDSHDKMTPLPEPDRDTPKAGEGTSSPALAQSPSETGPTFTITTLANSHQQRAFQLLERIAL